jgi:DNA-directed RNA polymerase specialized sigma24 family protein
MRTAPAPRKAWALTQEAFDGFLAWLDADPHAAACKYEQIRRGLIRFFDVRRCATPGDHADQVIDRVARRLAEGADIYAADPYFYFQGVALRVFQEYLRSERAPVEVPLPMPEDAARMRQRLECMERCLQSLPAGTRAMMLDYCTIDKASKRRQRESIAARLGLTVNSLRIRVHRVREHLERSVTTCLERSGRRELK